MEDKLDIKVDVFGNVGVTHSRYQVEDTKKGVQTSGEMAGWFETSRVGLEPDKEPLTGTIPLVTRSPSSGVTRSSRCFAPSSPR